MKEIFKITLLVFLLLASYPLYSQLKVESNFDREKSQLNVKLTNETSLVIVFWTQHLENAPNISIQSFDAQDNAIEWLSYPQLGHGGPWLFEEYWKILKQNESHLLSINIKPDKSKREPKYFEVTYYLPHAYYDIKNIENEKEFLNKRSKYYKNSNSFWFRIQLEAKCQ